MSIIKNLPIKVKFLKTFFEGDFVESGMIANLIKAEYDAYYSCWMLTFDFTDFMEHNKPLFTESYFPNRETSKLEDKEHYTAIEAGCYENKLRAYFEVEDDFETEIVNYLEVL